MIEENVSISHAIVGEKVIVRKNAVISRGCILTNGAVIGEGVHLPEFTRVCMKRPADKVYCRDDITLNHYRRMANRMAMILSLSVKME